MKALEVGYFFNRRVTITQHALEKATERVGIQKAQADAWIRSQIRNASYVGKIIAECGKPTRYFAARGVLFALDAAEDRVVTLWKQDTAPTEMHEDVRKVALKHLRKAKREVSRARKELPIQICELEIELKALEIRKLKTSSAAVLATCEAKSNAIQARIDAINTEIALVEENYRKTLKGVAAYV